jgi:hypothetical protein
VLGEESVVRFVAASLQSFIRISKTIRTADIDGTSENNRALVRISVHILVVQGRGRLQKVRLLVSAAKFKRCTSGLQI